jgi:hypothetical protein
MANAVAIVNSGGVMAFSSFMAVEIDRDTVEDIWFSCGFEPSGIDWIVTDEAAAATNAEGYWMAGMNETNYWYRIAGLTAAAGINADGPQHISGADRTDADNDGEDAIFIPSGFFADTGCTNADHMVMRLYR